MLFAPARRATCIATTSTQLQHAVQVLVQNTLATPTSVDTILSVVKRNLALYEDTISTVGAPTPRPPPPPPSARMGMDEPVHFEQVKYLKRDRVLMEGIQNGVFAMSRSVNQ